MYKVLLFKARSHLCRGSMGPTSKKACVKERVAFMGGYNCRICTLFRVHYWIFAYGSRFVKIPQHFFQKGYHDDARI